MQLRKLLPMDINFEIRNLLEYFKKPTITDSPNSTKPTVYFVDAASYNNLGDQAIAYAINVFLKEKALNYEYVEISENELLRCLRNLKKQIKSQDIICLSGGGNMGNLYPRYESIRRKVIKNFPDNKIIIFPQTIDYENDNYGIREKKCSTKLYNNHKNLLICAREQKSFNIMSKIYNNVILVPDIVLYLNGSIGRCDEIKRYGIGVCLRDDKESILSIKDKENICSLLKLNAYKISQLTTTALKEIGVINRDIRQEMVQNKIKEFSQYEIVITDRLHGMIFSILAGVPCIAFDNSNQKISGVFKVVENEFKNVKIIEKDDISNIQKIIKKLNILDKKEFNIEENFKNLIDNL